MLLVLARRWDALGAAREPADPESLLWVFLVPALNEALVIEDSVKRLIAVEAPHKRIVVINDGSDDSTGEILAESFGGLAELEVVTRRPPNAKQGKAAALNHTYGELDRIVEEAGFERARTIVAIVDADGRLDPNAPARVAPHFANPLVGGVQVQVRIYNRQGLLTWFQDVEFGIYGRLFQAGRSDWGTAGMGGNGQFNRLTALDDIVEHPDAEEPLGPAGASVTTSSPAGPWHDRLTEDQDLGLRLIANGWSGRHELDTSVHQQGLSSLRLLYRQRTRWSQGNLQAMDLLPRIARAPDLAPLPRADLILYGLMPFLQGIVGAALLGAIYLTLTDQAGFWEETGFWQLVFFYALGFGGVIFGCIARGTAWGPLGAVRGVLIAQIYAFYSWLLWPVLRSLGAAPAHRPARVGEDPARGDPVGIST